MPPILGYSRLLSPIVAKSRIFPKPQSHSLHAKGEDGEEGSRFLFSLVRIASRVKYSRP
jgi:hypothetical protein